MIDSETESDAPLMESLRKRKLAQWEGVYAAAWVLLQVLSLDGQQFDWSPVLLRVITTTLGLGFFVTLVVAWVHGERGDNIRGDSRCAPLLREVGRAPEQLAKIEFKVTLPQ